MAGAEAVGTRALLPGEAFAGALPVWRGGAWGAGLPRVLT